MRTYRAYDLLAGNAILATFYLENTFQNEVSCTNTF